MKKFNKKLARTILFFLLGCAILVLLANFSLASNKLKIHFYNVGQGDAIYLRTPAHQDILIDGGPDLTILSKLGEDMPFYDRTIELVILTHPHADHLTGLVEVLKRYKVKQILSTGVIHTTPQYLEWLKLIKEKKIPLEIAEDNKKIKLGQVSLDILSPFDNIAGQTFEDLNNSSIVSKLIYGQNSVLFCGDAEKEVENKLLQEGKSLKADILKVGHHGSKDATSSEFLAKVRPEYAIISVGKNRFSHPSPEVLKNLEGIKVFRTDLDGDIEFVLDGNKIIKK